MKIRINWKKTLTIIADVVLAAYLVLAFTAFNKPDETAHVCTKVVINIADETTNGFINTKEITNTIKDKITTIIARNNRVTRKIFINIKS